MVRSDSSLWRPIFKCHSMIQWHERVRTFWNFPGLDGGCDGGIVRFITFIIIHVNYWKSSLLVTENGSSNTFCAGLFFLILNETLFWFCLLFTASVNISLHCYRYTGSSKAELCAEDLQWTTRILTAWTCTLTLTQEGVFIIFRLFSGWLGFILFLIHLTVFIFIWYKYKKVQCPCLINFFPNGNENLLSSKIITRLFFFPPCCCSKAKYKNTLSLPSVFVEFLWEKSVLF